MTELYKESTLFSDSALKGYWRLENVNDSSSSAYNLTNVGTTTFVAGKYSNAASLDGSGKYLYIAGASCANLEISGDQTWMCWFNATALADSKRIMAKGNAATSFRGIETSATGAIKFSFFNQTSVTSSYTITTGGWHFACARKATSGTTHAIWLDGTKTSVSYSGSATATTNLAFAIGNLGVEAGSTYLFNGLVDDAAIWNRALTDAEITQLYNTYTATTNYLTNYRGRKRIAGAVSV